MHSNKDKIFKDVKHYEIKANVLYIGVKGKAMAWRHVSMPEWPKLITYSTHATT